MKIISFAVNNFRTINGGLTNNTIKFEDSNTIFIFGQNNVGKSTFLYAYKTFIEHKDICKSDYFNQDENNTIEFEIIILLEEKDLNQLTIDNSNNNGYQSFIKKRDPENKIKVLKYSNKDKRDKGWGFKTWNFENQTYEDGQSFGIGTTFGNKLPKPILIKAMPNEDDVKKTLNEIMAIKAKSALNPDENVEFKNAEDTIRTLKDKMYNSQNIDKYQEQVNDEIKKIFPNIAFEIKPVNDKFNLTADKIGREYDIFCKNKQNDILIP